ncbi:MAG: hypothetical protein JST42_12265, partial [Bacteroidetes bacterium]|nr:hypothetical protein [Bacteroidota bacterium]
MKRDKPFDFKKDGSKGFPVVAIGASAGGSDAMCEVLASLAPETRAAYIYLQHGQKEDVAELVSRFAAVTGMPVKEAKDEEVVLPAYMYVVPPETEMVFSDGRLRVNRQGLRQRERRLVDKLFASLAKSWMGGVIGIVLSGDGEDGAGGLKAIKI